MNANIFQGKKIRLRPKTSADMEQDLMRIEKNDYDTEIDRLTDTIYLPSSAEVRREAMENDIKAFNSWESCNLVIETLDNIPVGGIAVTAANYANGTFSYGLGITREHWRKGYAFEAIQLLLNYYFGELRFHKCNVFIFDYAGEFC
jgi:RimJ/RimL family protein N-acetyltransferase